MSPKSHPDQPWRGVLEAGPHLLEADWQPGDPSRLPIALLHEGLGSVSLWRSFPVALAAATGRAVLTWSRPGYGQSSPRLERFEPDYMHRAAIEDLPQVLSAAGLEQAVLVGHSDGASIALIAAAMGSVATPGVVLMAPHVIAEDLTIASIEQAREAWVATDLPQRLGRHHADVAHAFRGWNDIWLDPRFREWDLRPLLPRLAVPVLAIQGREDEYGTLQQLDWIAEGAAGPVERLVLSPCRHSPHRDQEAAVLAAITDFLTPLP